MADIDSANFWKVTVDITQLSWVKHPEWLGRDSLVGDCATAIAKVNSVPDWESKTWSLKKGSSTLDRTKTTTAAGITTDDELVLVEV